MNIRAAFANALSVLTRAAAKAASHAASRAASRAASYAASHAATKTVEAYAYAYTSAWESGRAAFDAAYSPGDLDGEFVNSTSAEAYAEALAAGNCEADDLANALSDANLAAARSLAADKADEYSSKSQSYAYAVEALSRIADSRAEKKYQVDLEKI